MRFKSDFEDYTVPMTADAETVTRRFNKQTACGTVKLRFCKPRTVKRLRSYGKAPPKETVKLCCGKAPPMETVLFCYGKAPPRETVKLCCGKAPPMEMVPLCYEQPKYDGIITILSVKTRVI
ncbi:MAG: hypothetical protein LBC13_03790 [Clostridiales bacterium]|jgi:hypothetical protein|nr:hypothetical protein [Clostridiales bacterium]